MSGTQSSATQGNGPLKRDAPVAAGSEEAHTLGAGAARANDPKRRLHETGQPQQVDRRHAQSLLPVGWLRRVSRGLIAIVLLGMIAVAAFGFFALRSDVRALQNLSLERIEWKSARIETETIRFAERLQQYANGEPSMDEATLAAAHRQFEKRVRMYLNGSVGLRIRAYDLEAAVSTLLLLSEEIAPMMSAHGELDPESAADFAQRFSKAADALGEMALAVVWGEELRFHTIRAGLRESSENTLTLSIVAMVLSLALVAALAVEAQRYRRASRESRALARRARAASEAKSRFLSMMSHELRTPMNGVLGLVSLVRQSGLGERQQRLLERAEAAGRQMIDQLVDILDYSEMEYRASPIERAPFDPHALATALHDLFQPVAEREGISFTVECSVAGPPRVIGDFPRFRQIISHLTSFLIQRVATTDLSVTLSTTKNRIDVQIDLSEPDVGRPGWRACAIMGTFQDSTALRGDALGPAIARGLLSQLGGTINIENPTNGRARVLVALPIEPVAHARRSILIDTVTGTQAVIWKSLLNHLGESVYGEISCSQSPGLILYEPGGDDSERIRRLRNCFPEARVVAVGIGGSLRDADVTVSAPLTLSALQGLLKPQTVEHRDFSRDRDRSAAQVAFAVD